MTRLESRLRPAGPRLPGNAGYPFGFRLGPQNREAASSPRPPHFASAIIDPAARSASRVLSGVAVASLGHLELKAVISDILEPPEPAPSWLNLWMVSLCCRLLRFLAPGSDPLSQHVFFYWRR
jgi:hypothetical protein